MLLYYIMRIIFSSIIRKKPLKETDLFKGFRMYKEDTERDKKSIFQVVKDLEYLSRYWKTYPETYFIFGMYIKTFSSITRMKSFIPQAYFSNYANTALLKTYSILINDKILFHDLMNYYGLPTTILWFVYRDGCFYINNKIASINEIDTLISKINDKRIFMKRYRGGKGDGVFIFTKDTNGYYNDKGEKLMAQLILQKYNKIPLLFEKQLIQTEILKKFNPDTVNTIRVLVIKDKRNVNKIIGAAVRFGRKGGYMDNVSKGGVAVSIDINTGVLNDYGMRAYDSKHYYYHPDSKLQFKNTKIEEWDEIKKLIHKAMEAFPYYSGVGFDIATTPDGPVIIEINNGAGVLSPQFGKKEGLSNQFI